jgi:hypothetical protein
VSSLLVDTSNEGGEEVEALQDSEGRDTIEEVGEIEVKKDVATMRKSLFSRRLSSRSTSDDGMLAPVSAGIASRSRSGSTATSAKLREKGGHVVTGWKNKLSKRIGGSHAQSGGSAVTMPSEEDVLAQYDAYIFSRGLEDQRAQLDVLSLEGKWNLVREHMAESMEVRQKQKGSSSKKDPLKILQKITNEPSPATTEVLRQLVTSDSLVAHLPKLMEANVIGVVMATLTSVEGKPRKVAADQEMMADLLTTLRALINFPQALAVVMESGGPLVVVGCFDPSCDLFVRHGAVSLMRALCTAGQLAVQQIVTAWEAYRKTRLERGRFEHLAALFETCPEVQVRLSIAQLISAVIVGLSERSVRVSVRSDLIQMRYKGVLKELAESQSCGEDCRGKFEELLEEFVRLQAADERLLATAARPGRARSQSAAGNAADQGGSEEPNWGDLVLRSMTEMEKANPKAAGVLKSILDNVLLGFGNDESSLWQYQCCDRFSRMLCGMTELQQLTANFEQEAGAAFSPETVLANLLLGAAVQDRVQVLREEVFSLRQEMDDLKQAADITIVDLQAELEQLRNSAKARHKRKGKTLALSKSTTGDAEPTSLTKPRLHKNKTLKKKKPLKLVPGSPVAGSVDVEVGRLVAASPTIATADAERARTSPVLAVESDSDGAMPPPSSPAMTPLVLRHQMGTTPDRQTDSGDSDSD